MYNIGQISELSGYSQRMLRYLEEQGLLGPSRTQTNRRVFGDSDLAKILKIRRLKTLGFPYSEIRDLIDSSPEHLAQKGTDLLKRHQEAAHDLAEKIKSLEVICFGSMVTDSNQVLESFQPPKRTAYRIKMLEEVSEILERRWKSASCEIVYWKHGEFIKDAARWTTFSVFDIFKNSSSLCTFAEQELISQYLQAWNNAGLNLDANKVGDFNDDELQEFYGSYDIVIEHVFKDKSGQNIFRALLPYQSLFLVAEIKNR